MGIRQGLSKSKIISGLQCAKRLYLETYSPELRDVSGSGYAFATGDEVGELARTLDPGGTLIGHDNNLKAALEETCLLIEKGIDQVIYEATFSYNGVLIRADIAYLNDGALSFSEVKSSTRVKDYHVQDCAIQAWVIKQSGYLVDRIYLAHVNNEFIYQGNGDYEGLLHHEDITDRVNDLIPNVGGWVDLLREVLAREEPEIEVGAQCSSPFDCPFKGFCWPEPTEYPVTTLPGKGKIVYELLDEGIDDIRDIPEGRLTNANHLRVHRIILSGKEKLEQEAKNVLGELLYPRYYLDFETVGMAIPLWEGTRPYQSLPFQWSCHVERQEGAETEHFEFLDVSGKAPMRNLADSLIRNLGNEGCIFMYTSFERTVIKNLIGMFPDLEEGLGKLIERLVDLYPITKKCYYHPDMNGSWSIKYVLPAIAPELSYEDIGEVKDGLAAGKAYMELLDGETQPERKKMLETDLLEYCKLDTLAMVHLAHKLAGGAGTG